MPWRRTATATSSNMWRRRCATSWTTAGVMAATAVLQVACTRMHGMNYVHPCMQSTRAQRRCLASAAVFQVAYLNKAMQHYDAGIVVPTHYVLFTLSSIVGPSLLYQELLAARDLRT